MASRKRYAKGTAVSIAKKRQDEEIVRLGRRNASLKGQLTRLKKKGKR